MKKFSCVLMIILVSALLSACSIGNSGTTVKYENADRYTSGEAVITDTVKVIDVDWVCGSVNITEWAGSGISVSESSARDLSDNLKLTWLLEDGVLHIKYCKSGTKLPVDPPEKDLAIVLPEGMKPDGIEVAATSAKTDIDLSCDAGNIAVSSASGVQTIKVAAVDRVSLKAESGAISLIAEKAGNLTAKTASGTISLELGAAPAVSDINAASGSVTITLPADEGFRLDTKTASGTVASDFELVKDGDVYVHGAPEGSLNVKTASGSIILKSK